jgi:hypothetical protein
MNKTDAIPTLRQQMRMKIPPAAGQTRLCGHKDKDAINRRFDAARSPGSAYLFAWAKDGDRIFLFFVSCASFD